MGVDGDTINTHNQIIKKIKGAHYLFVLFGLPRHFAQRFLCACVCVSVCVDQMEKLQYGNHMGTL